MSRKSSEKMSTLLKSDLWLVGHDLPARVFICSSGLVPRKQVDARKIGRNPIHPADSLVLLFVFLLFFIFIFQL